jgi:hypothetical protein
MGVFDKSKGGFYSSKGRLHSLEQYWEVQVLAGVKLVQ